MPSFLAWDLVLLFAEAPRKTMDLAAIREHLAVESEQLEEELRLLVNAKLLASMDDGWFLQPDNGLAQDLQAFLAATQDSKGRLKLLTLFLERQQGR